MQTNFACLFCLKIIIFLVKGGRKMAIQFARLEMVKRSAGKNACQKAAYNGRLKIKCETLGKTYNYSNRSGSAFHKIFLPFNADKKFENAALLWNEVEKNETRINSQVAREMVLALPDNPEVSVEHKIAMAKEFLSQHFVDNGVAIQLDIHFPNGKEEKNWHAHALITTRRFDEKGKELGSKARDLDARVCKGRVVNANSWGDLWRDFQNEYFRKHNIDLEVDETGIIPQRHLGPVRFREESSFGFY